LAVLAALSLIAGAAHGSTVLFVLDASGSMWGQVDGTAKIEIARKVLNDLIADLPDDVEVGLEAYGHNRKNDCTDIQMVAPVGSDRQTLVAAVAGLSPKGMTPLTESVRLAGAALKEKEGATSIVVVSDGKETCEGDPCTAASEIRASGTDLRIHVVGFDVTPDEAAQLNCIAENGGGKYFGAKNADELVKAFAEVKEEVVAPEPPPPPAKQATVFFRDDFDGSDLDPQWEVINPDPELYIVEEGSLLTLNSKPGAFADDTVQNIFRLVRPMPKGDWIATAKISVDFQTGQERIFWGLYEDGKNYLVTEFSTVSGSCYPGGSHHLHLNASPTKVSAGNPTKSSGEVWKIPHCDGRGFNELMSQPQPILLRLEKKGRSYVSSVKMEGIKEPAWVDLDKLTMLKGAGKFALGLYQAAQGSGETSLSVDWVQIESFE
jgi:hypothetical protein